jgi:hypothetical protein
MTTENISLLTWKNFKFAGAFRLPAEKELSEDETYSPCRGGIEIGETSETMFVRGFKKVGGKKKMAWGEVVIPVLDSNLTALSGLPRADVIQDMVDVESRVDKYDEKANRMLHAYHVDGGLLCNLIEQYDANKPNEYFLARVKNAHNLADSEVDGLFKVDGKYLAAGWMGELPDKWKQLLGATHFMGNTHMFSIVGRASSGPTFFTCNLDGIMSADLSEGLRSRGLMYYKNSGRHSLFATRYPEQTEKYGFGAMHYNITENRKNPDHGVVLADGTRHPNARSISVNYPDQAPPAGNDIWTVLSRVGVGFVVGDTYACIGSSAGHQHGLGYRIRNDRGYQSSGPLPYIQDDTSQFYWLFDMNDLLRVKNAEIEPHEILPYEYGPFKTPLTGLGHYAGQDGRNPVLGGTFDPVCNRVYISLRGADGHKPVIVAYDIGVG